MSATVVTENLLPDEWAEINPYELQLLLYDWSGGTGQYVEDHPNRLHLPKAGDECRVVLVFGRNKHTRSIVRIEAGAAFDEDLWAEVCGKAERELLGNSPSRIARDFSFCTYRVPGWWRGEKSGVQILPAPDNGRALPESAKHPFILEFPVAGTEVPQLSSYRRVRGHHTLTLALNLLLKGNTSHQLIRNQHLWAVFVNEAGESRSEWVCSGYYGALGKGWGDELSDEVGEPLQEVEEKGYYDVLGHDGSPLSVPSNLDDAICWYLGLPTADGACFDRAMFWLDLARRQWEVSISASFTSLVSAVESLTKRGETHVVHCNECSKDVSHDHPGATAQFRSFFEDNAPSDTPPKVLSRMYSLRSGVVHGSELAQLDQARWYGWDPPSTSDLRLYSELSSLTYAALRNWLKTHGAESMSG